MSVENVETYPREDADAKDGDKVVVDNDKDKVCNEMGWKGFIVDDDDSMTLVEKVGIRTKDSLVDAFLRFLAISPDRDVTLDSNLSPPWTVMVKACCCCCDVAAPSCRDAAEAVASAVAEMIHVEVELRIS